MNNLFNDFFFQIAYLSLARNHNTREFQYPPYAILDAPLTLLQHFIKH